MLSQGGGYDSSQLVQDEGVKSSEVSLEGVSGGEGNSGMKTVALGGADDDVAV